VLLAQIKQNLKGLERNSVMRKINVVEFVSLDGVIEARASERKIPVTARHGGYVHIATLFLERP